MKFFKELKWNSIVSSLIYIGLGIILFFMPETSLEVILNVIGIGTIIVGILSLIRYFTYDARDSFYRNDFLFGLIGIAIGALIFLRKDIFASLIPFILGIAILISGFVKLQDAIDASRLGYKNSIIYIILAVINIIAGVVVILNPFTTAVMLFMIIGISLIFSGISDIISTVYLSRKIKKIYNQMNKNIIEAEYKEKDHD